eukprot:sb/3468021/
MPHRKIYPFYQIRKKLFWLCSIVTMLIYVAVTCVTIMMTAGDSTKNENTFLNQLIISLAIPFPVMATLFGTTLAIFILLRKPNPEVPISPEKRRASWNIILVTMVYFFYYLSHLSVYIALYVTSSSQHPTVDKIICRCNSFYRVLDVILFFIFLHFFYLFNLFETVWVIIIMRSDQDLSGQCSDHSSCALRESGQANALTDQDCIGRKLEKYLARAGLEPATSALHRHCSTWLLLQSDPYLVTPDLVTPRFSDRINFPRYRKLTVFDPDLVATPI